MVRSSSARSHPLARSVARASLYSTASPSPARPPSLPAAVPSTSSTITRKGPRRRFRRSVALSWSAMRSTRRTKAGKDPFHWKWGGGGDARSIRRVHGVATRDRWGPRKRLDVPRLFRDGLDAVEDPRALEGLVDLRKAFLEIRLMLPVEDEVVGADDERESGDRLQPCGDLDRGAAFWREVEVHVAVHGGKRIVKTRFSPT